MPKELLTIDLSDAVGKTVAATLEDYDVAVIAFTDDTAVLIKGSETGYVYSSHESLRLAPDALRKLGAYSDDEWAEIERQREAQDAAQRKAAEARDRAEYEKLKARFEGK